MAIRNAKAVAWAPKGCSDTVDGTTSFKGAMQLLTNLIPDPTTDNCYVPRPASSKLTGFSGFNTPTGVTALLVVGDTAYGFLSSALHSGKDQPFSYNIKTNSFNTISGITAANVPATQLTTGDWTPPTLDVVGGVIMFTHPGFPGNGVNFGWLDISGFTSVGLTGNSNSNQTINNISNMAGIKVGMLVTAADVPSNTYVTSVNVTGSSITISNAATGTNAGEAITFSGGTPSAPLWGAGDLQGYPIGGVPSFVKNFYNRAYFIYKNTTPYSDSLDPRTATNAGQALTIGDTTSCTAMGTTPFNSTTGGIVQGLIVFKKNAPFQIQGDAALNNLTLSPINVGVGTSSPLSLASTPRGLSFVANDGLRFVDIYGNITPPLGSHGEGISYPFVAAEFPSRISSAYNSHTLRISVQNGGVGGSPWQDWWLDFTRTDFVDGKGECWTGPHTFPSNFCQPWENAFLTVPQSAPAGLWQSNSIPTSEDSYVENGTGLTWYWQTSLLPDTQKMSLNSVIESSIGFGCYLNQQILTFIALDESGNILSQVQINEGGAPTIWDSFDWGDDIWLGGFLPYQQHLIPWDQPLVANQMSIQINGFSNSGFKIGILFLRYQPLGYMVQS